MNSTFQKKFTFQTKCIYSAYIYLPSEINRSHENYISRENTYFLRECIFLERMPNYQFATVALKICSTRSFTIWLTSSS